MRAAIRKVIALDFGRETGNRLPEIVPANAPKAEVRGIALLVTRDLLSQQWAPRWLQQAGLDVKIAKTAEEALEILSTIQPTIIISDTTFKGGGRIPLLEDLRKQCADATPIIALCDDNADVTMAAKSDVTDIVRRPYEWELITRRIVKAVKAQRTKDELRLVHAQLDEMNSTASKAESERARNAGMDALTKLPNIEKFRSLLHKATSGRGSENRNLCLLAIGIDRFRVVNEAVGYQNANLLLSQFADRLRDCLRDREVIGDLSSGSVTAIAARLGGARFALLVSHGDEAQIQRVNLAITRELREPFEASGQSVYLTASIGAAIHPRDCTSVDELLNNAETAMLDAQQLGSGFQFFADLGRSGSHEILALDVMLRDAVRKNELTLAYQPITNATSGEVVAAEALLRWHHPKEGMISPELFVPIAESTGLMHEIGDFVLATACRQLRHWIDAGMKPIRIAVNLSLCQLLRGDIVSTVAKTLQDNDLPPDLLELELSERGVLNQRSEVIDVVCKLKSLGIRISVDDFGTGHAAISYLKDLPIDVIKIDRSYVSGANRDKRDEAIASGMVALAQRLDATVIAEGVETRDQLQMLREWGSQECQGYYFCAAIPGDQFQSRFAGTRAPRF